MLSKSIFSQEFDNRDFAITTRKSQKKITKEVENQSNFKQTHIN